MLVFPSLFLALIAAASCKTYIDVMYDGRWDPISRVEGLNFAVQTLTTVGYGNWEKPAMGEVPNQAQRVFLMRRWSIVYMVAGATYYTLYTGIFAGLIVMFAQHSLLRLPEKHHE